MNLCTRAASALTLLLIATAPVTAQPAPPAVIHIANFNFSPKTLTVAPGQSVTFINDDSEPHTATAVDKAFDSGGLDLHDSWKHTFSKPGTYAYFCAMHPYMKGTIVVAGRAAQQ